MFLLPSLFTTGNIALGFVSIALTIRSLAGNAPHDLDWAAIAILLAIPFDSLDGRIARMTNTCSDFGKELDSLADAVTFGVAPAILAMIWGFHYLPEDMNPLWRENLQHIGAFVCFLFLIGGVSRLARFNISHDPIPRNPGRPDRKYFVGMPIPAAAGLVASTVHFCNGVPVYQMWASIVWMVLVAVGGYLMVSTWRFWSGKEINFSRSHSFQFLLPLAVVLYVILRFSSGALFTIALLYMFSGIWARAAYSWQRRRRRSAAALSVVDPGSAEPAARKEPFQP
jgi:CDP-diacylglycerol--serine O-phosphatidyltransferase